MKLNIIISTSFWQAKLRPKQGLLENKSFIQYGYRKCETRVLVFSQSLGNGSSRMKWDKESDEEGKQERVNMGKKRSGHEIKDVPAAHQSINGWIA